MTDNWTISSVWLHIEHTRYEIIRFIEYLLFQIRNAIFLFLSLSPFCRYSNRKFSNEKIVHLKINQTTWNDSFKLRKFHLEILNFFHSKVRDAIIYMNIKNKTNCKTMKPSPFRIIFLFRNDALRIQSLLFLYQRRTTIALSTHRTASIEASLSTIIYVKPCMYVHTNTHNVCGMYIPYGMNIDRCCYIFHFNSAHFQWNKWNEEHIYFAHKSIFIHNTMPLIIVHIS